MENRRKEEDPEMQRPLVETPSEAPEKPKGGVSTVSVGAASSSSGSAGKAITSCLMYSFCSVSMVLVNKSLASSYNHLIQGDLNFFLVVIQAIVAVVAVEFCKFMKWVEYPNFNISTGGPKRTFTL